MPDTRHTNFDLAIDSAAFLIAVLGWLFLIWVPVIIISVGVYLRGAGLLVKVYLISLATLVALAVLLGFLFKWAASGIVRRKPIQIVVATVTLIALDIGMYILPSISGQYQGADRFEGFVQGAGLAIVAIVTAMGLGRLGPSNE